MTVTEPMGVLPSIPVWVRHPHQAVWLVGAVMAVASIVGIIAYAQDYAGPQLVPAYMALAVGMAACAIAAASAARKNTIMRWVALSLAVAAPFAAVWAGIDPILEWNLALFSTEMLTMSGMPVWYGLFPAVGSYVAVTLAEQGGWTTVDAFIAGGSTLAFAVLGTSIFARRLYWDQVIIRSRDLMAARDAAVARGVAEERLSIARDLHDVIGHEIAAVNLRLGAAEVHLDTAPDQARSDLQAARGNIQTVLAETQHLLAVLRTAGDNSQTFRDYTQIPTLIQNTRDSGLGVEATLPDAPPPLTAESSRAVYRIVQEMLTNASKHGTGEVSIRIGIDDGWLTIDAVNIAADEDRATSPQVGFGLVGMKERAASVGGTLTTSVDKPLFWTHARLPLAPFQPTDSKPKEDS